jgi:hypothetical protein
MPTLHGCGKYRWLRLFVIALKYFGQAFRKVVWNSGKETGGPALYNAGLSVQKL